MLITARRLLSRSRRYLKQFAKLGEVGYRFGKLGAVERRRLLQLSRAIKLDPRDQEIILESIREVDLQNLYSKYIFPA